ncbi:MAG TPA: threonylcarbamoyl-AMP synthase [Flavobacteriales bacterium]|nr:threonylcarbamoyl-AMP synthase [Flavobacteriales bacterium]
MSLLLEVHPDYPNRHSITNIVQCLRNGGVIVYPTDTVYAFGCDIYNNKALERVCRIKGIKMSKANFSFICSSLSHISDYSRNVSTPVYKLMRKSLPGPYTFILQATSTVPKLFKSKKKTVGIRVPDNRIALDILEELGNPLLSTSIPRDEDLLTYPTDPQVIYERYKHVTDITVDGGFGNNEESTVIDCTGEEPEIIREGLGVFEL